VSVSCCPLKLGSGLLFCSSNCCCCRLCLIVESTVYP
jgi:hypothetical protein